MQLVESISAVVTAYVCVGGFIPVCGGDIRSLCGEDGTTSDV